MSIYQNVDSKELINVNATIIPDNWTCRHCQHFGLAHDWDWRGQCACAFERMSDGSFRRAKTHEAAVRVFYQDDSALMCQSVIDSHRVAELCADDEQYHLIGDTAHADDNECYTRDYARSNFYQCESCGVYVTDYYDFDSDLRMCRSCAEEYRREHSRIIGDWHEHKGEFFVIGDRSDRKTLGFEMEVEGYDCDHENEAQYIDSEFDDAFVFEYDCSLYDGFEIISQPHTLEAFERLDLEHLERILRMDGYGETDDAETTGLHVHFSTAFLGDSEGERVQTLARLVRFYDWNFGALCDMTDRKNIDHSSANCDRHHVDGDYHNDTDLFEATLNGTRYVAVNASNYNRNNTIEIRLCDGTICADKIRAWVDFNIGLFNCLKENNTTSMTDAAAYMSDRAIEYFGL